MEGPFVSCCAPLNQLKVQSRMQPKNEFSDSSDAENSESSCSTFTYEDNICTQSYFSSSEYLEQTIANIKKQIGMKQVLDFSNRAKNSVECAVVDWCIRVYLKMALNKETLFLAVNIFNKISKIRKIRKGHIQLFAATALWIASKIEETNTPSITDFYLVCGKIYKLEEFEACERCYLRNLGFDVANPTIDFYIQAFFGHNETSEEYKNVVELLSLCSLFLEDGEHPDAMASAILTAANSLTNESHSTCDNTFHANSDEVKLITPLLTDQLMKLKSNNNFIICEQYKYIFDTMQL